MLTFEQKLWNLGREEQIQEQPAEMELEGSDLLKHLEYLSKTLNEVVDAVNSRDKMLCEDIEIIDKAQMECIKQLGEILDTIEKNT